MSFSFHTTTEADLAALDELIRQYTQAHPQRTNPPVQIYVSPYFDEGRRVLCARDAAGRLVGFAPYFSQGDHAWVEIMLFPGLEAAEPVRRALWKWLLDQAGLNGQQRLFFQYLPVETDAIEFVTCQGGEYRYSIFTMQRHLGKPVPDAALPGGFDLRRWRMESEAEQCSYLEARNTCFPEAPTSLDEWQYFAGSPLWEHGINLAVFAGDRLAASVLVYALPGDGLGATENVFTLPEYRGNGLARALLAAALDELKRQGFRMAALEVRAGNRSALSVYSGLGYEVEAESRVYEVVAG